MKFSRLILLLHIFFLTHCKSPSDQIKEAFNTVDKSLEKSNDVLSTSIEELYSAINSVRTQNEQLALRADSIYDATKQATQFMDSLKKTMQLQDSSGNRLDLATNVLISTNVQHQLTKALTHVYNTTSDYEIDSIKKQRLDSVLLSIKDIQSDRQWTKKYFETTPTVAAITILSKFQNDCTNAATIVLGDIKQRLEE
jgi:methyl-accepting chemotaxis protein